jgi:hypothetical protein
MGPAALLPLQRKSCYEFLSRLEIHCPQLRMNMQSVVEWQAC